MRLLVAIVPPPEALDELDRVIGAVTPGSAAESARRRTSSSGTGQHAHPRRRLFGRGQKQAEPTPHEGGPPEHDQLDRTPVAGLYIPITTIGNLTQGDSLELRNALRTKAATWERPTLHFSGGTALEWSGDLSVWAKLDGDIDRLALVGAGVPTVVKQLALFVDRRQFRPWLAVGTITEQTTAPYLEELVAALERFHGSSWTQESFSVIKALPETGFFEVVEDMALAE